MTQEFSSQPLISVGVPVRNGGFFLADALQQLIDQNYPHLEIIISDNGSTDNTAEICMRFVEKDSRIYYYYQEKILSGPENFRFVCEKAKGDYFMWAAHDDRHALNYIQVLLQGALDNPGCSLVFSNAFDFNDHRKMQPVPLIYDFTTDERTSFFTKIQRLLYRSTHFYGLYPRRIFKGWYWQESDFGWDQIFLAFANMRGDFKKVDGTQFYYYRPANRASKTPKKRAIENVYRSLKPYAEVRRAWAIVKAACYGEKLNGRNHSRLWNFLRLYLIYIWLPHAKQKIYNIAPKFLKKIWQPIKT